MSGTNHLHSYQKETVQDVEAKAPQEQPATLAMESLALELERESYTLERLSNQYGKDNYIQGILL